MSVGLEERLPMTKFWFHFLQYECGDDLTARVAGELEGTLLVLDSTSYCESMSKGCLNVELKDTYFHYEKAKVTKMGDMSRTVL